MLSTRELEVSQATQEKMERGEKRFQLVQEMRADRVANIRRMGEERKESQMDIMGVR